MEKVIDATNKSEGALIPIELYNMLDRLGIIDSYFCNGSRSYNEGASDYSCKLIQPWTVWIAYPELTSWDHDIIKRVLRHKTESGLSDTESRILDYKKIVHNCKERIRHLTVTPESKSVKA